MKTTLFDYVLPPELIAQEPVSPRDSSRLLVVRGAPEEGALMEHRLFRDLPGYLEAGDLLILNHTRVLRARLLGRRQPSGGRVEVLLLRRAEAHGVDPVTLPGAEPDETVWEALVRPGRRLRPGAVIAFGEGPGGPRLTGRVMVRTESGGRLIAFSTAQSGESLETVLEALGRVPLPPYVTRGLEDDERYQTIYAERRGSAAAPTAGLHFTPELLERLAVGGVRKEFVNLNIGLDTFRPVREEEVERHRMHREAYEVPYETAEAVVACRRRGGRVVACGTTVVRALEAAADPNRPGLVLPGRGETSLFIYPGYGFRVVDLLITNFHLPRSTLLMLVSAFAGVERIREAYCEASRMRYRFYSFGDAMLVYRGEVKPPADGGMDPGGEG